MRDLCSVLQELQRHDVNCRVQSVLGCGFTIVLSDALNGDLASFDVLPEDLPDAGDRLWELACRQRLRAGAASTPRSRPPGRDPDSPRASGEDESSTDSASRNYN